MDAERDQLQLAKYLPHPLFVIFSETRAYAKVYGKLFYYVLYFSHIRDCDLYRFFNCDAYS